LNFSHIGPQIDFDLLGQQGFVGNFQGLSYYSPSLHRHPFNSSQAQVIVKLDDQLFSLGTLSPQGQVNALCVLQNPQTKHTEIYLGGTFTSFGGVSVSNIAKYDLDADIITGLYNGLDSDVYALYCDSSQGM